MIASVDRFLLDREDDRPEVLVVGEVVPVLGPVEVLLVRLLLDGGKFETLLLLPLLLDRCLFSAEMLTGKCELGPRVCVYVRMGGCGRRGVVGVRGECRRMMIRGICVNADGVRGTVGVSCSIFFRTRERKREKEKKKRFYSTSTALLPGWIMISLSTFHVWLKWKAFFGDSTISTLARCPSLRRLRRGRCSCVPAAVRCHPGRRPRGPIRCRPISCADWGRISSGGNTRSNNPVWESDCAGSLRRIRLRRRKKKQIKEHY